VGGYRLQSIHEDIFGNQAHLANADVLTISNDSRQQQSLVGPGRLVAKTLMGESIQEARQPIHLTEYIPQRDYPIGRIQ